MNGLYSESTTKTQVLLKIKKLEDPTLTELSNEFGISKAAILKHIVDLEKEGLLERKYIPSGKGRPVCKVLMTEKGHDVLPKSYSFMAMEALEYVENKLGRESVGEILRLRSEKILFQYRLTIENLNQENKIERLKEIRNSDGYMAETRKLGKNTFELCESNCPIMQISDKYGEACTSERNLFSELLNADVETTHRIVSGARTCRFLIKYRESYE